MGEADPVAVFGFHAEDVAHYVDFKLVKVAVYAGA